MDRGGWEATVHRVTKSQEQLKRLGMHAVYLIHVTFKGIKMFITTKIHPCIVTSCKELTHWERL